MTTLTRALPFGTPCWVDLNVPDPDTARTFYGRLFDWETPAGPSEYGGYTVCLRDERPAAGIVPTPPEGGMPSAWGAYLSVPDLDAVVTDVRAAGGTVLFEPMQVGSMGRMAYATDASGAGFGMWEAGEHAGFGVVDEPGSVVWSEVMTRDHDRARDFYARVFGYTYDDTGDHQFVYSSAKGVDGQVVAGVGQLGEDVPAAVPGHWRVYFGVADTDASVRRAEELGGTVIDGPFDSPFGRTAGVRGPGGETFFLVSVTSPA